MWEVISGIYTLISKKDKFKVKILIILVFLMTLFEIIGLALILPFLFLVNNLNIAINNVYLNSIYNYFDFQNTFSFLAAVGGLAIVFSLFGVVLSIYTNLKLTKVANNIGTDFSIRLLSFLKNNDDVKMSSETYKNYRKKILTDTTIVSNSMVLPSIMIISKTMLIGILFMALSLVNYKIMLLFIFALLAIYAPLYYFSNQKIKKNMQRIEILKEKRSLLIYTVLRKSDIASTEKKELLKKYFSVTYELSRHQSFSSVISKLPRYIIMFLVFSSVVCVSIYLTYVNSEDMIDIMPKMLIFIIVGLKTLPQIQNVFINYLKIKSNIFSLKNISQDLHQASK